MIENRSATVAAAGIAGLIGDCSVRIALKEARRRFRCIRMDRISREDFITSPTSQEPARGLFERTQPCKMAECDAFLSHSWHDPLDSKWATLQHWRTTFIAKNRREPCIWFDKACIDQTNIEEDLRCLPIFVGGCNELLVLCGTSYLNRLWCVVELFTFLHTGGNISKVTFNRLCYEDNLHEESIKLEDAIDTFDVKKCSCFNPADKEKMLPIIMSAFGDLDKFSDNVRELLKHANEES